MKPGKKGKRFRPLPGGIPNYDFKIIQVRNITGNNHFVYGTSVTVTITNDGTGEKRKGMVAHTALLLDNRDGVTGTELMTVYDAVRRDLIC